MKTIKGLEAKLKKAYKGDADQNKAFIFKASIQIQVLKDVKKLIGESLKKYFCEHLVRLKSKIEG